MKPGDVVFTGTCEGVIGGYPPDKQVWLKPGDKIIGMLGQRGEVIKASDAGSRKMPRPMVLPTTSGVVWDVATRAASAGFM